MAAEDCYTTWSWKFAVAHDETLLGYADWILEQLRKNSHVLDVNAQGKCVLTGLWDTRLASYTEILEDRSREFGLVQGGTWKSPVLDTPVDLVEVNPDGQILERITPENPHASIDFFGLTPY